MRRIVDRVALAVDTSVTLGEVMERLAVVHRDRRLVEEPGGPLLTFAEAAARVRRLAGGIAAVIAPGDRVVVATPNGYDQFLTCLAACRAGGVAVPVNPHMRPAEIDHVVADSGATLIVRDPETVLGEELLESRSSTPDQVAAIFYTSGTTGKPKGAELTHRGIAGSMAAASLWPSGVRRDEIVCALPVAHIMGFGILLAAAATGVPLYSLPKFDATAVLDAIESRRATVFIGVPAMYRMLLEAGAEQRDLSSVRLWVSGADVMPSDLMRRFQRMGATASLPVVGWTFGDAMFAEGYGMVETAGAVALRLSPPGLALPAPLLGGGSLGIPLPGYHLRVVDEDGHDVPTGQIGELVVRGPGVLTGYHGDAAATSHVLDGDGWLHTGDLARRGLGGLVTFAGRAKDVIKSGGYSVYAVEIERVMEQHPDVLEAAAVGIPDDRLGERLVVAVRVRPGATVTEAELAAWGAEQLSDYKRPRSVRIVEDLPRTGTQKVAKQELVGLLT